MGERAEGGERARRPASGCLGVLLGLTLAVSPAAAAEIQPGVHRLAGIEETLPHDDLEPLAGIVGKTKILGLGEAVHTTGGFSRAKVRLFRFLVEEMGFRAFGFESSWINAERVAEYVRTCKGTVRNAIGGLFGVWQSDSVRDLVLWMCRWNQEHPDDPVHFYGFDHQQGAQDLIGLRRYLRDFGLPESDERAVALGRCNTLGVPGSAADHEACLTALAGVESFLDRNEDEIVARTSAEDLEWARIHLVGLRSFENEIWYFESDLPRAHEARDSGMAYIAERIRALRFPDARTALWAHNFHILRGKIAGIRVMGYFLKKAFKRRYQAIGLVAYEAETDWPGVNCGHLVTAEEGSVEELLHALGEPHLLVDLDFPGGDPPFLRSGRRYDINWGWELVPRRRFAGLVYLDFAARMEPLAWERCQP